MTSQTNESYYLEATATRASCRLCNTELDASIDPPVCPQCGWRPDGGDGR